MDEKDYAVIPVGTEVSAKFKGAFCEAKIGKSSKCIRCRVVFEGEQNPCVVLDENVKGNLKVGEKVEARASPSKPYRKATLIKVVDDTLYTVVFNDGDQRSLKRNQLCIKGDKHFTESESLDSMPLVHPEEFGSPVLNKSSNREKKDDSWIGQVVCVEVELKSGQAIFCPALVVAVDAQGRRAKKDHLIVRSFLDNKFMTVQKKETKPYRTDSQLQDNISSQSSEDGDKKGTRGKSNTDEKSLPKPVAKAFERAVAYWENDVLPDAWNRSQLIDIEDEETSAAAKRGSNKSDGKDDDDAESSSSLSSFESSDEEGQPSEKRDRFVAHLYRFMDERGTPLNKVPTLGNKDLDLYRLYNIVQHCGGFNRVNKRDKWLSIYKRMHIPLSSTARMQIIRAYKKYLQPFEECNRKLGSPMALPFGGDGLTRLRRPPPQTRPSTSTTSSIAATPSAPSGSTAKASSATTVTSTGKSSPQQNDKQASASSSTLPSRRSSAMGESDSGVSEKNSTTPASSTKPSSGGKESAGRRSRRESQSKDETAELVEKKNRRLSDQPSTKSSRGRPKTGPQSRPTVDSNDGDSSDNENNEESSHSGDDTSSSSNEYSTSLLPSVSAQAGFQPNSNLPLPLDTLVKVKCRRGSVTANYEGKITARKRDDFGEYRYHIHYRGWNSRYDEWIVAGRISHLIKIGEETNGEQAASNVGSSGGSSVPNSVVSASESDLTVSNDEKMAEPSAPVTANLPTSSKQQEVSPDKEDKSSVSGGTSNASPVNNENETTGPVKSSQCASSRKRKADEQQQGAKSGSTEKNVAAVKDTSVEPTVNEKLAKKDSQSTVGSTRSTRSKPVDEVVPTTSNGVPRGPGGRRGGYRGHHLKNVPKDDTSGGDGVADSSGEKAKSMATPQIAAIALSQSKSPSKVATEHRRLNRPNKFNFHLAEEMDKCGTREERIAFIMGKIGEIRSMYGDLKSKVADIDKKRRLYRAHVASSKNSQTSSGSNFSATTTASITIKQQSQIGEMSFSQTVSSVVTSEATPTATSARS